MIRVQPDLLSIDRNEIKKYTSIFHVTYVSPERKKTSTQTDLIDQQK